MVENRIMFTLGLVDSDITSCPASIAIWKAHISANNTSAVHSKFVLWSKKSFYITYLQVNNYEIVVKNFHISHKLT